MLISALCDYYDVLAKKRLVLPDGYSQVGVSYLISITSEGKLDGIFDWTVKTEIVGKNGKVKETFSPRSICLTERTQKTAIDGNIIEHKPLYIFGLNYDSKAKKFTCYDEKNAAKKSHEAFTVKNLDFIEGIDSPVVNAYRNFILSWNREEETENPFLLSIGNKYSKCSYAFCLSGRPDLLLHEDEQLNKKWQSIYLSQKADTADVVSQCAVTGEMAPIANTHKVIKGVPGGRKGDKILICFNNSSECSYGRKQSFNSNISATAMKKYTYALNYLIGSKKHRTILDDFTIVHWAASGDERYDDVASMLMLGNKMDESKTDDYLKDIAKAAANGTVTKEKLEGILDIDPNVDFYFVGIKPTGSRLAVKFIYRQKFGTLLTNIAQHQQDMKVAEENVAPTFVSILNSTVSSKSNKSNDNNNKINPALTARLANSVINATAYPDALLCTTIQRVRTDSDDRVNGFYQINNTRIGIIKACINRKSRLLKQKEEIKMALDKSNSNPAYLCGRLFAVLESIQLKASNYSLNKNIRDTYFSAASSRPSAVLPKLLTLAQYHLAKLNNPIYYNADIKEIIDMLDNAFPEMLSITEQGKFIIGYYQQKSYIDNEIKKYKEENDNGNQQQV